MRWHATAALLLTLGIAPSAADQELGAEESAAVRWSEADGAWLVEARVPGPLEEVEAFVAPSGERSLVLLVAPAEGSEGPRFLYQLRLGESVALSDLPVVLPPGADALASTDLTGDGRAELLVGEPGRIFRLTGEGKLEPVLQGAGVDLKSRARSALDGSTIDTDELVMVAVGHANRYSLNATSGSLEPVASYVIPVDASLRRNWLRLSSPLVSALPSEEGGRRFTYVVGPISVSNRRLRTLILQPAADSGAQVTELWSRLPGPETVEESHYAILDGEIVLLVTTIEADRRGIFEKEKFRILRLSRDRSRSGAAPILELETRTRNWYRSSARLLDLNGDGADDVVLIQPKGLGAGKLVVEAFTGSGEGTFNSKARKTTLEIETELWHYGADLDLDGIPDLVLIEDQNLLIFTGVPAGSGELVVRAEPAWRVPIGEVDDRLRIMDVQGDRRPEILLIETSGRGFGDDQRWPQDASEESRERPVEPDLGRLSLVILSGPTASESVSP